MMSQPNDSDSRSTLKSVAEDTNRLSPFGRPVSPCEDARGRSPSPRYRRYSDSTTPTSTPTPTPSGESEMEERRVRKVKSVSFHSHTNWKNERKIKNAADCLQYMMEGSALIKIRPNGRQYHRYFRLVEDLSAIRWTPTSKKASRAQVPVDQIKEVRTGRNCESLRNKDFPPHYNEERVFSILYGDSYESLDLIAHTPEESSIWVTGINALIGASKSPETCGCVEEGRLPDTLRENWLKDVFRNASGDSTGFIDEITCIQLIKRLDSQVATVRVKQKLQEFDLVKSDGFRGRVDSREFVDMFKEISTRPEIYFLLIRHANRDYFTLEDFHLFLEGEQGLSGVSKDKVMEILQRYEPAPEARKKGQLLIDGFTKYLMSEECDIFSPAHRGVCQDMTQPLTHYFISTSHNTYLLEDQLKGPSSLDGYIRVLTCGCRCVKVDVWDGIEEPVVYHGNTLTSKILFSEVVDAIAAYSFDYSIYPVIVHIENHCSIRQQKMMAEILRTYLGNYLYLHPKNSEKPFTLMSPEELKYKIIVKGKVLLDEFDEGEVTDEDEGGGETKRNNNPRKIRLCKELSSLMVIPRTQFIDLHSLKKKRPNKDSCCSISESWAAKLTHSCHEDFVNYNKDILTRVYPNSSRVDSSNFNPQDFWNSGCQMVALNFQTPGQMMDVYEGKFRANGNCGYVLKPSVMREQISVFSANAKESIPGVATQMLKIKIISGQYLPKPRGSTATKASFIDPYVVVQVFGIPADCAELRTRTVSDDGSYPVFDETFDFVIHLPELAVIRFVVLDDDYIGDDFIGQYTIPFECLQTGYRHVCLLSSMGEPMENVTLFVHISISNRPGGGEMSSKLLEAEQIENSVEMAWADLQEECGLEHTANLKQCLKIVISRFLDSPDISNLTIVKENGIPFLRCSKPRPLPSHLHKLESALEKLVLEMHHFLNSVNPLKDSLMAQVKPALNLYEDLESHISKQALKGRKANRARENFAWNVRTVRGQIDRLLVLQKRCKTAFDQLESTKFTLSSLSNRDRSPSVRERPRLTITNRHYTTDNLTCSGLGRSPTSPSSLDTIATLKPKSILKKSNSNIESSSLCYVNEEYTPSPAGSFTVGNGEEEDEELVKLLKPPLQQSLSFTPGFTYEPNTAL